MAYNNPFMNALQQGGSVANQSASVGSQYMNNATNLLNSAGSLSMKMITLLEQEEARKQQELLNTTGLLHKIYQDSITTQLKRQQLEQQKEYQDNMMDINKIKLGLEERKLGIDEKRLGLEKEKLDLTKQAMLSKQQPEYSFKKITDPFTGEEKVIAINKHNPTDFYNIPTLQEPNNISSNINQNTNSQLTLNLPQQNTKNNTDYKSLFLSLPIDIKQSFTKDKYFTSKYPYQNFVSFYKNVSNIIEPTEFIKNIKSNNIDSIFNKLSENQSGVKGDAIVLSKLNPYLVHSINKINPTALPTFLAHIKDKTKNIINYLASHGEIDKIKELREHLMSVLGDDLYKKQKFDELFNYGSQAIKQYNTLGNIDLYQLQDYSGISGMPKLFGFDENIIRQAIKDAGTPALTKATYYLNKDYLSSYPKLKGLFTSDALFFVTNDATKKRGLFADKQNIKILDPEIKNIVETLNNEYKYSIIGTPKGRKEINEFLQKNKSFNLDSTQTMPYELYKANKDYIPDLSSDFNKLIQALNKPKYRKLIDSVNNFLISKINDYKNLYPNKDENELYIMALRDVVDKFGKEQTEKAIVYNNLLLKALAESKYH